MPAPHHLIFYGPYALLDTHPTCQSAEGDFFCCVQLEEILSILCFFMFAQEVQFYSLRQLEDNFFALVALFATLNFELLYTC